MVAAPNPRRPSDKRHKRPRVLLTGFDPFGGDSLNPSWLVARALHRKGIGGHQIVAGLLPTEFGASLARLRWLMDAHRPALVISLGLAATRAALSLERVAINVDDARIADNAGAQPIDTPVVKAGPAAYFSTLPIKAMQQAIQGAGVPVEISQTAGTFVCNHVFYGLMHGLATVRGFNGVRSGFIHVPMLPEQGAPSLPLDWMVEGLRVGIRTALTVHDDVRSVGGAID